MASSVTTIATTKVLSSTAAVLLAGVIKLIGKDMQAADQVFIYEETATEGTYQLVERPGVNVKLHLDSAQRSVIFEGYGNYKFLLGPNTDPDLVVGYVAA